jgi:hypothetical protein
MYPKTRISAKLLNTGCKDFITKDQILKTQGN